MRYPTHTNLGTIAARIAMVLLCVALAGFASSAHAATTGPGRDSSRSRRAHPHRFVARAKLGALLIAMPIVASVSMGLPLRFDSGGAPALHPAVQARNILRQLEHADFAQETASTARITLSNRSTASSGFTELGHTALRIEYPGVDRTYDYGESDYYDPKGPDGRAILRVWESNAAFLTDDAPYGTMSSHTYAVRPATALLIEQQLRTQINPSVLVQSNGQFLQYQFTADYHLLKRNCTLTSFRAVASQLPKLRAAAAGENRGRGLNIGYKLTAWFGGWPSEVFTPDDLDAVLTAHDARSPGSFD